MLLLSSKRPIFEMLQPNMIDQRLSLENPFTGMKDEPFAHNDYEDTRNKLMVIIQNGLSDYDKKFFLNFIRLMPDWKVDNFQRFAAVNWKNAQSWKVEK